MRWPFWLALGMYAGFILIGFLEKRAPKEKPEDTTDRMVRRTREAEHALDGLAFREAGIEHPWENLRLSRLYRRTDSFFADGAEDWGAFNLCYKCRQIIDLKGYGYGVVDMLEEFVRTLQALSITDTGLVVPAGNCIEVSRIAAELDRHFETVLEKLRAEDAETMAGLADRNRETLVKIAGLVASLREDVS